MNYIFSDWSANRGNNKGRLIMLLFRVASLANAKPKWFVLVMSPYLLFYRVFVEWVLGCEIPWRTKIGRNLRLFHGQALVIHPGVVIGENCLLRQCVTIGLAADSDSAPPVIGNNVEIGCNSVILGNISVADNVLIGAGSVVVRSIPDGVVVVGNPARVIRNNEVK